MSKSGTLFEEVHMAIRLVVVSASLLLASCGSSPMEPLADLVVATDRSAYVLGEPVVVEIRNTTEMDAFFAHCDHRFFHRIQQRIEGTWTDRGSWGPTCPAIYLSGVEVLIPGTAKRMTTAIHERGTYRLVFETASQSTAIGAVNVESNVFEVQ